MHRFLFAAIVGTLALLATSCIGLTDDVNNWYGVDNLEPVSSTNINSYVFDIQAIDDTIYVVGKFRDIKPSGLPPVGGQPYLAAFDADTGVWDQSFTPQLNGPAYALEKSPDGSTLFVGGEFTVVNGQSLPGFAALAPDTGDLIGSWTTGIGGANSTVRAMHLDGSTLYVGGNFLWAYDGTATTNVQSVVRLDAVTGAIDTAWTPIVSGGGVWGIAPSADLDRVYLAGLFTVVDGVTKRGFAAVDSTAGDLVAGIDHFYADSRINTHYNHDVLVAHGLVYVGGSQHQVNVYNESDWSLAWSHITNADAGQSASGGDIQDFELFNGIVYAACHCWGTVWSSTEQLTLYVDEWAIPTVDNKTTVRAIFAMNAATGARNDSFQPVLNGVAGPWAMEGHSPTGCLWAGGQMSQQDGVARKNLTRFCPTGGPL